MWKLQAADLNQLRGSGGENFVHFVDMLIRGAAAVNGIPQSEVKTQIRVNIKDGGVDTQVKVAILQDSSGWFAVPTCWQFKAVDGVDVSDDPDSSSNDLIKEINKPYVKELICIGYGYRLCLLGDMTPEKVKKWETILCKEALKIFPAAQDPKVVCGSDLMTWGDKFPAVFSWLHKVQHQGLHIDSWGLNCKKITPKYIDNPDWSSVKDKIVQHVDLNRTSPFKSCCIPLSGEAGIGKTRLIYELLVGLEQSRSLVIYASDEQMSKQIATLMASNTNSNAILVADDCTIGTKHFLEENLRGHANRIRVICIYSPSERPESLHPELTLKQHDLKNTEKILEINFHDVPRERRYQYSQLSSGYIRLAADMCYNDHKIASGHQGALISSVDTYIRSRLTPRQLEIAGLIGLFNKVGIRDDVKYELQSISQYSGVPVHEIYDAVTSMKESPGFIAIAGRYCYVTPEIVGHMLYNEGWKRWVGSDLTVLLQSLPESLKHGVIDRASNSHNEEVRRHTGAFFRRWFRDLTAESLVDDENMQLIEAAVEVQPDEYLPMLRELLERSGSEALLQITGESRQGKWGPRRTLVWLLERLVSFSEYFADCESCLFLLAYSESEPEIGNNATAIWSNLFSIYLSGTSLPFEDRIKYLESRLSSNDERAVKLGLNAVKTILQHPSGHIVGRPVVSGRLRPADWQPSTYQERTACYNSVLEICANIIRTSESWKSSLASELFITNIATLISKNLIDQIKDIADNNLLTQEQKIALVIAVDSYLEMRTGVDVQLNKETEQRYSSIQTWVDALRPTDFYGRMRSTCSRNPWEFRGPSDVDNQPNEIVVLAEEIIADPDKILDHLKWLETDEASSCHRMGIELGKMDDRLLVLGHVMDYALKECSARLLSGYLLGMSMTNKTMPSSYDSYLDSYEKSCPAKVVELFYYGGDVVNGFDRALRMVASGVISARNLYSFSLGVGNREITGDEITKILSSLVEQASDNDVLNAAIRFITTVIHRAKSKDRHVFENAGDVDLLWQITEKSVPQLSGRLVYEWLEVIRYLSNHDINRAAKTMCDTLLIKNVSIDDLFQQELIEVAERAPESVMEGFGDALLDKEMGWLMQVYELSNIVSTLPEDIVIGWTKKHGKYGAKKLARHLPKPIYGESETPVVPSVTDKILAEYGDERVMSNFAASVHTGEVWTGNPSQQLRERAEKTRKLLMHANAKIREWAKYEIEYLVASAEREDRFHEEMDLKD